MQKRKHSDAGRLLRKQMSKQHSSHKNKCITAFVKKSSTVMLLSVNYVIEKI